MTGETFKGINELGQFLLGCTCREAHFGVKDEKVLVERERERT